MFTAALLIVIPNWKPSICSTTAEWKRYVPKIEYHKVIRINEPQLYATSWINLTEIKQSKTSQTPKNMYCKISLI